MHSLPMHPKMIKESLVVLNVGTGVDLTIKDLAEQIAAADGFEGQSVTSMPDGTPKKQLDVDRLSSSVGGRGHSE